MTMDEHTDNEIPECVRNQAKILQSIRDAEHDLARCHERLGHWNERLATAQRDTKEAIGKSRVLNQPYFTLDGKLYQLCGDGALEELSVHHIEAERGFPA